MRHARVRLDEAVDLPGERWMACARIVRAPSAPARSYTSR